ncbi:MAG: hypothetical protein ACOY4R_28225 [Pseudomonadota bacterium]
MKPKPRWDLRCAEIMQRDAARHTNAEMVERIEAETGMRFSVFTVSRNRATLGIAPPWRNDWTVPLRQRHGGRSGAGGWRLERVALTFGPHSIAVLATAG